MPFTPKEATATSTTGGYGIRRRKPPGWSRCGMGSGNGALKIGGSRLRVTNVLRAGLSITGQESAAFITARTAALKFKEEKMVDSDIEITHWMPLPEPPEEKHE